MRKKKAWRQMEWVETQTSAAEKRKWDGRKSVNAFFALLLCGWVS